MHTEARAFMAINDLGTWKDMMKQLHDEDEICWQYMQAFDSQSMYAQDYICTWTSLDDTNMMALSNLRV
jgi:hypothetical protein